MAKKFAEHKGLDLTKTNKETLAMWEKNDIFHKSIDEREGCPQFIFFEEIGRASVGKECVRRCRSRWSPYH